MRGREAVGKAGWNPALVGKPDFSLPTRASLATDRVAVAKADYDQYGAGRTNLRSGYIQPTAA